MKSSKPWMAGSLEALIFLALGVTLLQKITDPDIWFHLAIGREIFSLGALPMQEFLVYPNADLAGAFHEWGYALLYYLIHQSAGFWGMSIVNATLCTLAFWFLFRATGPRPLANPVNIILLLMVVLWMEFRLVYRVEVVLYLALACEIWLLECFLRHRDWRLLTPIPLIGLLLSQMHPSVIMLLIVLGAYALQITWEHRKNRQLLVRFMSWMALCGAVTLLLAAINPYGWQQVVLPFTFAQEKRVTHYVSEFLPSLISPLKWQFIILLTLCITAVAANRSRRLVDLLLLLGFGYLAYKYARNIGLLALVMYVPGAHGLTDIVQNVRSRPGTTNGNGGTRIIELSMWAVVVMLAVWSFNARISHPRWGAGIAPGVFPETTARQINDIQPAGRIFNFYDFGGYLAWVLNGKYQVSIDGRHYIANRAFALHNAVTSGRPGWQRALDRYDVNTIIMPGVRGYEAQLIPLARILVDDPNWLLAGREEKALLFFRKGSVPRLPAEFYLPKREIWKQVGAQAEEYISRLPGRAPAYYSLGEALWGLGERNAAVEAFQHYLQLAPHDQKVADRLAQLEAELGQLQN
jgi:hypothetical protein